MKEMINLCFLADDNYIMQTCITLNSLYLNKSKNSNYIIHLILNSGSDENIKRIKKLENDSFKINIIKIDRIDELLKFNIEEISASPTAICKFYIPEILNELDKVIYIDGDVIINSDLSDLYNIDIKNNYIGAVKDTCGLSRSLYKLFKKDVFYFNSGVMIMNLKKMREENISKKLMDYRINGYNQLMDQDALNYVFKNKVYELPFIYNTQLCCIEDVKRFNEQKQIVVLKKYFNISYTISCFQDIINEAIILHYSGSLKPWNIGEVAENDLWFYYYYCSPYRDIKLKRKKKNKKKTKLVKKIIKRAKRYKFMKKFKKKGEYNDK